MSYLYLVIASVLLVGTSNANAADPLCGILKDYARAQWAERTDPAPRHWVEFHWGTDPDPLALWSWGCRHSDDVASAQLCNWLLDNTSHEFRSILPIRIQKCMGFRFPGAAKAYWGLTDGQVSRAGHDGTSIVLELSCRGMAPAESAIRISFDSDDRRLEPDELPPIASMSEAPDALDLN